MTEYDYSEEAIQAYLATQDRISRWADTTHRVPQADPETPRTPAPSDAPLPRHSRKSQSVRDRTRSTGDGSRERDRERGRRRREREVTPPPPMPMPPRGVKLGRSHSGGPPPVRARTAPPRELEGYNGIYAAPPAPATTQATRHHHNRHASQQTQPGPHPLYLGVPSGPPSPTHRDYPHPGPVKHRRSNSLPQSHAAPMHHTHHAPPVPIDPLQPQSYSFAVPPTFGPVARPNANGFPVRPGVPLRTNSNPVNPAYLREGPNHGHPGIVAPQPRHAAPAVSPLRGGGQGHIHPSQQQHAPHPHPHAQPPPPSAPPAYAHGSASAPHLPHAPQPHAHAHAHPHPSPGPPPPHLHPRAATPGAGIGGGLGSRSRLAPVPSVPMSVPMPTAKEPSWLKRVFGFRVGLNGRRV
ncbi:hypothetical protein HMN09_01391900 [Mycena chlorophos]|uniref:Uncharacterized protein n=1 Tax=Mycena chlorophos TaxID=658473 RepID=A0A8H6RV39_MYCCL|nr:hypothetical protein HMN09_01391900 [Mycena chlorophos]